MFLIRYISFFVYFCLFLCLLQKNKHITMHCLGKCLCRKEKQAWCVFSLPSQTGMDKSVIVVYVDKVKYLDFFFIQLINTVQNVNDYFKNKTEKEKLEPFHGGWIPPPLFIYLFIYFEFIDFHQAFACGSV